MMSTLSAAIRKQNLSEVQRLLSIGFLPDGSKDDSSPMIAAIDTGQLTMVKTLLDYGASPDKHNALSRACSGEHPNMPIIIELLSRGANPDGFELRSGRMCPAQVPLLQHMIIAGKTEIVTLLIQYGASVGKCNLTTILRTPYIEAKRARQIACIKLLIAKLPSLSSVHQRLYQEFTNPVTTKLTFTNQDEALQVLIKVSAEGDIAAIEALVARGVNVNAKTKGGHNFGNETALHGAARQGQSAAIMCLVKHGADIQATSYYGITPLHQAAMYGHAAAVDCLIRCGANVRAMGRHGLGTPLHVAAGRGHVEVINTLMMHGAKIDALSETGMTPLHDAAVAQQREVIDCLVRHGANVHAKNKSDQTASAFVAMLGKKDIALKLQAYEKQYPPGPRPSAVQVIEQSAPASSSSSSSSSSTASPTPIISMLNAAPASSQTAADMGGTAPSQVSPAVSEGYTASEVAAISVTVTAITFVGLWGASKLLGGNSPPPKPPESTCTIM